MKPRPSFLAAAGVLLAGLLLSGCWTVSVHPLFTDDTLTYDEHLVGTWTAGETTAETTIFTRLDDQQYKTGKYGIIYYAAKGEPLLLEGRLVKLGEQRYLDVYPPSKEKGPADAHYIEVHSFWKVSLESDKLRLAPLDFDWLRVLLDKDPRAIRGVLMGANDILLTGSTEELQAFIRRHSEQAFKDKEENVWRRVPPAKKD